LKPVGRFARILVLITGSIPVGGVPARPAANVNMLAVRVTPLRSTQEKTPLRALFVKIVRVANNRLVLDKALIREEEKRFVFPDRAADLAAELVAV